jgi:hypothetical protein
MAAIIRSYVRLSDAQRSSSTKLGIRNSISHQPLAIMHELRTYRIVERDGDVEKWGENLPVFSFWPVFLFADY